MQVISYGMWKMISHETITIAMCAKEYRHIDYSMVCGNKKQTKNCFSLQ